MLLLNLANEVVLHKSSFNRKTLLPMSSQGWLFKLLGIRPSVVLLVGEASASWESLVSCPDVLDVTDKVLYSRKPNKYRCLELRPRWSRGIGPAESTFCIRVKDRKCTPRVRCASLTTRMAQCSRMEVFSTGYCWQHGKVLTTVLLSELVSDTSWPYSVRSTMLMRI
jgi:hypothetical protein